MQELLCRCFLPFYDDVINQMKIYETFETLPRATAKNEGWIAERQKKTVRNKSENHFNAAYGHDVYVMIIVRDCL